MELRKGDWVWSRGRFWNLVDLLWSKDQHGVAYCTEGPCLAWTPDDGAIARLRMDEVRPAAEDELELLCLAWPEHMPSR